jgi:hypothetical protein
LRGDLGLHRPDLAARLENEVKLRALAVDALPPRCRRLGRRPVRQILGLPGIGDHGERPIDAHA